MDSVILNFFNRTLANPVLDVLMIALSTGAMVLLPGIGALYAIRGDRRTAKAVLTALAAGMMVTLWPTTIRRM